MISRVGRLRRGGCWVFAFDDVAMGNWEAGEGRHYGNRRSSKRAYAQAVFTIFEKKPAADL
jgi:hypothetical protein